MEERDGSGWRLDQLARPLNGSPSAVFDTQLNAVYGSPARVRGSHSLHSQVPSRTPLDRQPLPSALRMQQGCIKDAGQEEEGRTRPDVQQEIDGKPRPSRHRPVLLRIRLSRMPISMFSPSQSSGTLQTLDPLDGRAGLDDKDPRGQG